MRAHLIVQVLCEPQILRSSLAQMPGGQVRIYWVSTGLLAGIYLGVGRCHLSNISGFTSRNKMRLDRMNCDSILEMDATGRPLADRAREIIYWYFAKVTKIKANIGVSKVEKQAAGAGEDA